MSKQPYRQIIRMKDSNGDVGTIVLMPDKEGTRVDSWWKPEIDPRFVVPSLLISAHHLVRDEEVRVKLLTLIGITTSEVIRLHTETDNDDRPF